MPETVTLISDEAMTDVSWRWFTRVRFEQDHRGIRSRCRPMLGLKSTGSAVRFCRGYDEVRDFLQC